MNTFFNVSKFIVVPILSEWLVLVDFSRLLCSLDSSCRQKLIELCNEFKEQFNVLTTATRVYLSEAKLLWCSKHCCGLRGKLQESKLPLKLNSTTYKYVVSLQIYAYNDSRSKNSENCKIKLSILTSCMCLKELIIDEVKEEDCTLTFETLEEPLSSIEVLHINDARDFTRYLPLLRACPNLIEFDTYYASIDVLRTLIVWCRKLRRLKATFHYKTSYSLVALHYSKKLCEVTLSYDCKSLQFRALLFYSSGIECISTHSSSEMIVDALDCAQPDLHAITRWDCHIGGVTKVDLNVLQVLTQCSNLTELDVACFNITDEAFSLLFSGVLPLRKLYLSDYKQVGQFNRIVFFCGHLRELHMPQRSDKTNLNDVGLVALGKHCPHLNHLNIEYQRNITDEGFKSIVVNGRLVDLNIGYCSLTEATFLSVTQHCTKILSLAAFGIEISPVVLLHCWQLNSFAAHSKDKDMQACIARIKATRRKIHFYVSTK